MLNALIIFAAKDLIYLDIVAFVVFLLWVRWGVKGRLVVITLIAMPLAYVIAKIAAHFWYDTRPFVLTGAAPLIEHAADNGFPSDHLLLAGTIASIVTLRYPRLGLLFWLIAAFIGWARVAAHVHHPIDIIASAVIGMVSAFIAFEIVILRRVRTSDTGAASQ